MRNQHLFFRGSSYYFVARIPQDVKEFFPVQVVWRSLKTRNIKIAKSLLRKFEYKAERIFMQIRSDMLTDEQIRVLVAEFLHGELDSSERDRAREESMRNQLTCTDKGLDLVAEVCQRISGDVRKDLARNKSDYSAIVAEAIIEKKSLSIEKDTDDFRRLCREILKAEVHRLAIESQRTMGEYSGERETAAFTLFPRPPEKGLKLSEIMQKYSEDRIKNNKWAAPSTIKDMKSSYDLLRRVKGDFFVNDLTYDFALSFRDTLEVLPPNSNKGKFAGKSVSEILQIPDLLPMSTSNLNKNVRRMSDLIKFAREKNLATAVDYFKDLLKVEEIKEEDKRRPFTSEEITRVIYYFLSDLGIKIKKRDRRKKIHPDYVWIFVISLYTGIRSNELCQMTVDDVCEIEGFWCLVVKHEPEKNKTTKNIYSRRLIPIPPQIKEIGFLDFVERRKTIENGRIWESVSLDQYGKWNKNFGRNINSYIDKAGITAKNVCFYSTRHNASNALYDHVEASLETIQDVVGHSSKTMKILKDIKGHASQTTLERTYLKKHLPKRYEALSKVNYGLNLDEIRNELWSLIAAFENEFRPDSC